MVPRVDSPIVPSAAIAKSWLGGGSNTKTVMASPSPTESSQSPSTTPKAPTSPLGRALAAGFGAGFKLPPLPLPSRVSSKATGDDSTSEDGNGVVVRDNSTGTTSTASSHDPLEQNDSTGSNMASLAPVASGDEEVEAAMIVQEHTEATNPARSVVAAVTSTAKGLLGGGKEARDDGHDGSPPSLAEATAKVHGYNNGGHEYFSKGDYHRALQFYTRALRWAHKAERAVDAAGGVAEDEGPSEAETAAAMTISPSSSADGASQAAAVVATTAGQVASGITSGLQLARGKANKLMNRLPLKRHSTCPAGSNGTLSASLTSNGSIRDGQVITAATRASTFLLVPLTLLNVAQCHLARYEMDAATQSYRAAIVRMTSAPLNLPSTHPDVSQIEMKIEEADRIRQTLRTTLNLHTFGESAEVNGRYQDARNTYLTALSMVVETTGTRVHPLVASTLRHLGSVQWKCGQHNDALQSLSECVTIYTHCFGDFNPDEQDKDKDTEDTSSVSVQSRLEDTAEALSCLGMVHQARGECEESLGYYREAARVRRKIHGDDHPDVARLLVRIASLYDEFGLSRDKAFDLLAEALDIQRRALEVQQQTPKSEGDAGGANAGTSSSLLPLDVAFTLNMIGSLYEKTGTFMAAMSSYSEALAIYRTGFGAAADTHVDVASTLCNLGNVYKYVGRYDEALDVYVRALYIYKTTLGEAHRNVATALHNVSTIHTLRGDYDVALEMLQQVHALQVACFRTEDHPDVACTIDSIGEIYERRGDIASQHHQQAAIAAAAVEEENPSGSVNGLFFSGRGSNSNNAAAVEAQQFAAEAQKQYRAASQQYKSALRVRRTVFGSSEQAYFVALSLHKLALFYYNKDRNAGEAKRRFDQALKIYCQSLRMEVSDPEVAEVMQFLHRIKSERHGFRKFMKQDSGSTDEEDDAKPIDAFQRDGAASPSFTTPTAAAMATSLTLEQQMAWISASSPPGSTNTTDSRRQEFYPEYVDVEGDVGLEDDESDKEDDARWKLQQQHLQFQSSQMHDYYASAVSSSNNSHEVPPYEGDFC